MRGWPNDDSHPTVLSPRKMKLLSGNPTLSGGVFVAIANSLASLQVRDVPYSDWVGEKFIFTRRSRYQFSNYIGGVHVAILT
jgi:hypothetical protein